MHLEGGAADIGAVEEDRLDAKIFADRDGREGVGAGRGAKPVDVLQLQACIGDRRQRCLAQKLDRGAAVQRFPLMQHLFR